MVLSATVFFLPPAPHLPNFDGKEKVCKIRSDSSKEEVGEGRQKESQFAGWGGGGQVKLAVDIAWLLPPGEISSLLSQ